MGKVERKGEKEVKRRGKWPKGETKRRVREHK